MTGDSERALAAELLRAEHVMFLAGEHDGFVHQDAHAGLIEIAVRREHPYLPRELVTALAEATASGIASARESALAGAVREADLVREILGHYLHAVGVVADYFAASTNQRSARR